MVQAQPKGKKQQASELQVRYQNVVREVHSFPQIMLAKLLHEIADVMGSQAPDSNGSKAEAVINGHRKRNGSNGVATLAPDVQSESAEDEESERPSGWDIVIAQGGPMAEVARMLKRGNLTDEERQQMKEMAYDAVISMPEPVEPPPTYEEAKEILHRHRMEKYGR